MRRRLCSDLVEVFGPGMTDERVAPAEFESGALAFAVDDIVSARAELAAGSSSSVTSCERAT
jgi:hypothetical protein